MNNIKGFTLIELLIVVAIIGILAIIGIPAYIGQQKKATRTEAYTNLETLRLLEEQYFAENGCYYRPGGVCSNATLDGVAAIQGFLPGFRPASSLQYNYKITINSAGSGGGTASCFIAEATGAGPRVTGDLFTIDCNNNRTF